MKPYRRPVPRTWWLTNRAYFLFILRELTSVFIAVYLVLLLMLVRNLGLGEEAYNRWLAMLASPGMILFHVVVLIAALYHTVTWFNLTPNVLPMRVGVRKVPAVFIAGPNYVAWIVISGFIAWLLVWG